MARGDECGYDYFVTNFCNGHGVYLSCNTRRITVIGAGLLSTLKVRNVILQMRAGRHVLAPAARR